MSPQDPQNAALLAHIVSQIEQNVEFLASQNYISNGDASAILTRLPNVDQNSSGINGLTSRAANLGIGNRNIPPPVIPRPVPAPATGAQSRALWGYNENGQDPNDLSFAAGDIIEIVEETNADWWTGRVNGKQGLFPSTYVERLAPAAASHGDIAAPAKKPYKPFGAAYHGMNAPPPPGQGVNSVGLQEKEGTEAKKDKFGAYKNTLAHSAAGGVGFGAGAAIGGGLVRAIF
ncbi:SH3-domain-containing protein [Phlegmacium glaucopus]|nr:SH3-domain-containing protein [Phlegmacium glaucopus]